MVATTPTSKRRPYPYDMYIGDVRVILEPQADGNLVSQKSKTLDETAPTDYTYSSANPFKERAFEWTQLYGGYGQAVAPSTGVPRRYAYAIKADLSVDGLWMKGPKFETHIQTIDAAAGEVRQIILAAHGAGTAWFAICENGIWRRTADTASGGWTVSLSAASLGAGVNPIQAVRFQHRGTSPVDALYVATDNSNLWQYNGSTWTVAGLGAGPPNNEARAIERVNDELWVAGDYTVSKVQDDPMDRLKYAAAIYVGDQSARINWLKSIGDVLYIFKEDGVYTVDTTGLDHELFSTLRGKNSRANGRNAAVWIDRMWFTYGDQTFTMTEDAALQPDGMEQMLENTSPVKGTWVAGAGHNTWFLYELVYNSVNDTTYLIKHGTWVEEGSNQNTPGVAQFAEAHHGALYDWDKKATCAEIVPDLEAAGNDRLYVGFLDGTVQWCILPQHTPNPAQDSSCEFTSGDSYVYLPIHHGGFQADNKLWHGVTAMGPTLSATEWAEVQYRLDVSNALAEWTTLLPDDPKFTLPAQRKAFVADAVADSVWGQYMEIRVKLSKDPDLGSSPAYASPVMEGIALHESVRPAFSREFTVSVKAASYLPRRDGVADRRRGSAILDALIEECQRVGPVNCTMPTGETEPWTLVGYRDSAASYGKRRDHEWLVQIQGIQLGFNSVQRGTTYSGLTYATLEQYTLGQLESII
jgi:hypothetical protein